MAPDSWNHWFYHVLDNPEAAGLIKWWNDLFKDSIIVLGKWSYHERLGKGGQESGYALN